MRHSSESTAAGHSDEVKVTILRHPAADDWARAKLLALSTVGKTPVSTPDACWKHNLLDCEHSPIRTLMFTIRMDNLPYWVSVHFSRHKHGVEHYVRSQRPDITGYHRGNQDAPVTHIMDINAQALLTIARRRLCTKAALETRRAMQAVCDAVIRVNPEFKGFLSPMCVYRGGCHEMRGCGYYERSGT